MESAHYDRQQAEAHGNDPPLSACPEPIAIVGMACRWPGKISSSVKLWEMLKEKRSGFAEFPPEKLNVDGFYHPNQHRPGSFYTRGGFFINEDTKQFDHGLFGITPLETMTMDPAQRKLLEVVYEAFENAGEPWDKFSGSRTGVFVGNFNYDHQVMQFRDADHPLPYVVTGGGITILSNRINYVFNLHGPSMTIDTACSSSMYALHLAVNAMRNGDCDSAIVAGSNMILGPEAQLFTTKLGAISPTSICHTFDAAADGYARAEGIGAIYLRKVSDAVNGSYPIRAVIRGTAMNANGRTGGISHPSPEGQEAVIRQAYKSAGGLDPSLTGYFECHGTGTPVGDPLEVSAIGKVFAKHHQGEDRLLIGSVKTNLGHSESASGIAGIMKAVLAIEHGIIPPTIGLVNPNPNIDFEGSRVKVVTEMTPWPLKPIRRVSINSFGYGGANAHCILDHPCAIIPGYRLPGIPKPAYSINGNGLHWNPTTVNGHGSLNGNGVQKISTNGTTNGISSFHLTSPISRYSQDWERRSRRRLLVFPFSGNDDVSLRANISVINGVIASYKTEDIAYTLSARRSKFNQRAFALVECHNASALEAESMTFGKAQSTQAKKLGFVFTGQGAQWARMGAELFEEFVVFRDTIVYLDGILQKLNGRRPQWTIEEVLFDHSDRIQQAQLSQTICTAVQIALVNLLLSWSVKPFAVVGHSSGEIAAAYSGGYLTAAEAIVMAYFRGYVVGENKKKGKMLAVGIGPEAVLSYLHGYETVVKVAAVNSPDSVTLSGEIEQIDKIADMLKSAGIFNRVLKTGGNAYHSHHMAALGESYEELATRGLDQIASDIEKEKEVGRTTSIWISSVIPYKGAGKSATSPSYWRRNLESPVFFSQALHRLGQVHGSDLDMLIEIGPHPALGGPLKQIRASLKSQGYDLPLCFASLTRGQDSLRSMLSLAGNLFLKNYPVDLAKVNASDEFTNGRLVQIKGSLCVDLPNYAYHYGSNIFFENRFSKEWRNRKHLRHDLLGAKQPGTAKGRPSWRNILRLKDVPWLDDHKLLPHPVFPAAGYIAMAVEAVSQIHQETATTLPPAGFSLRNVAITSTLQIPDDEFGVEVLLNMQAAYLTNSTSSRKWYEFKISSVMPETENWTEHCSGMICVESTKAASKRILPVTPRSMKRMDIHRWYEKFGEVGLGYGPNFQGLSNLTAHPSESFVTADVQLSPVDSQMKGPESTYAIHPSTLDTCLQLALIAAHSGNTDEVKSAYVPINIDDISIWTQNPATPESRGAGISRGELRGLRGLYAQTQLFDQSGAPLLDIKQLRCVTYSGPAAESQLTGSHQSRNPYLRLLWKPDINELSQERAAIMYPPITKLEVVGPIFEQLDRLSAYILVQIATVYGNKPSHQRPKSDHLKTFLEWVKRCSIAAEEGSIRFGTEAVTISEEKRIETIELLAHQLRDVTEAKLVKRVYDNLARIFAEETSGLQVALEDGLLTDLYVDGIGIVAAYPQLQNIVDLVAHKNPRMKILEIGAGTGGATRILMHTLRGRANNKRYKDYTFTDVTTSFLAAAEAEFKLCGNMTYRALDIERDPTEQGYEPVYDCIIASQVLHATTTISTTLKNARKLLKPGGKMILVELTRTHIATGLVLGTFPDYWKGVEDGRVDSPLMGKQRWQDELAKSGFSGIDVLLDDHPAPFETASVIVTTAVPGDAPKILDPIYPVSGSALPCVFIACQGGPTPFAHVLTKLLRTQHINPICVSISSSPTLPEGSRVISLADTDRHSAILFSDKATFYGLQKVLQKASSLLWISTGGLIKSQNPEAGMMTGLMGTLTTEMPNVRLAYMDFDPEYEGSLEETAKIVANRERALQEEAVPFEGGFCLHNGTLHVSRLVPDEELNRQFNLAKATASGRAEQTISSLGPVKLNFDQPGILSSLFFEPDHEFSQPLADDWVEIKTEAMGLNIKDLAVATGRFDWNKFSTECAGVVCKTGKAVSGLHEGDRVYGAVPANFGNFARSPAISLQKMAPEDRFSEMASLPVAYMTAVYSLIHLGRVVRGESVLIQSATGGLGLAAIRIARHLGAEIYATVGTAEKVQVLVDKFDIPRDHIFSSRDITACKDIVEATGGRGIDVILCSSGGEQMHETWKCIAPRGRFIEVGRLDVLNHGKLSLEVFKRNATFSSFDLGLMNQQDPIFVSQLMTEVGELYRAGIVQPIDYIRTFDIAELEQAMMYFSKGIHLGKIVITFSDPSSTIKAAPIVPQASFDPHANYLLVGCLGGLGRSISSWMVERGALNLTYLSRSGTPKFGSEASALLRDLKSLGVNVQVITCDVAVKSDVASAVEQASSSLPIRGVIHAAMVLDDVTFADMTFSQLQKVLAPKVMGTRNLHNATLDQSLDFFIMTSSIVTAIGTATQASYSAANAFQDAFARFRTSQGLPALSIALGLILDVGFASERPDLQRSLNRNGVYGTGEAELLRLLETAFTSSTSQVVLGDQKQHNDLLTAAHLLCGMEPARIWELDQTGLGADFAWATDARFGGIAQAIEDFSTAKFSSSSRTGGNSGAGASVMERIKAASSGEATRVIVIEAIIDRLAKLLFLATDELDITKAVSEYGMDSMIAAELRNWLVKMFHTDISFLELLAPETKIEGLADRALAALGKA